MLSFQRAENISGNTNATLRTNGQVLAYLGSAGATHLVLDVNGYYIPPMRAELDSAGTLVRRSRVTSVTRIDTGRYQVDFDRDVTGCAYSATFLPQHP